MRPRLLFQAEDQQDAANEAGVRRRVVPDAKEKSGVQQDTRKPQALSLTSTSREVFWRAWNLTFLRVETRTEQGLHGMRGQVSSAVGRAWSHPLGDIVCWTCMFKESCSVRSLENEQSSSIIEPLLPWTLKARFDNVSSPTLSRGLKPTHSIFCPLIDLWTLFQGVLLKKYLLDFFRYFIATQKLSLLSIHFCPAIK